MILSLLLTYLDGIFMQLLLSEVNLLIFLVHLELAALLLGLLDGHGHSADPVNKSVLLHLDVLGLLLANSLSIVFYSLDLVLHV